ncbi:DNA helicase, ATP-dependent, RecQ type, bacterial [Penicillium camemberti]|uniref:ATP-dependent DNA helicase n=1 Tax=Penicillium camemberti (strain FM 013) TaxID=1429867 RepID=A0A0G4PGE8_PENC3|nr:DNA helicase, ATP-dependent, RecQ type, bacterial [Penicillium camemberti]
MSTDSESDYFDYDDFVVPGTPDGPSRPAKRRRVRNRGEEREGQDDGSSIDSFSDMEDDDLPSRRRESPHGFEEYQDRPKNKSCVLKQASVQNDMFVTQLTQPSSSPERIRGPRWQKPVTKPSPPKFETRLQDGGGGGGGGQDRDYTHDDEELIAAIAASLDSFEEEKTTRAVFNPPSLSNNTAPKKLAPPEQTNTHVSADVPFELEDIPEGAFDSSPLLSPVGRPVHPAAPQFSQSRGPIRQPHLRQSTLFGMVAPNPEVLVPRQQDWGPSEKTEPPTQHKLVTDALDTWVYPTNLGKTRDYQFNITQAGLFHNLLVALPTGLGKTFIAATIMLNWFRWTKDSQIIFVAPTKPLVSQQVSACLDIAGIPRSESTMLTGGASPGIRAQEWKSKRVFFMTPQTLINDLKTGIADPKRIVLLVVDEAHRATGAYAYVEVVKFLRRFNNSFRVLALTATPGSTVESVQAVIDGLDIARVEIRTENSIDIREYVHARNIEIETFENSDEMIFCMDLMSAALQPLLDQLRTLNAYWGLDPMGLTAYGLTVARQQWMQSDAGRNANFGLKGKVNSIFTVLASLAHAIDLLKYHGIVPFYRHVIHFKSSSEGQKGGGGKYQKQVVQDDNFKKLLSHLEPWSKNPEFIGHPKLEYLKSVILNHFMDRGEGKELPDGTGHPTTRVMIFVHFRDSAEEVTRVLKRYEPMIRPHVFVGQSSAKGSEGMDQKTQLRIIEDFKKGTYNTIVATSIGEEGLDIGEVDLIVCYDSSASPIRMLQRMGRTGRKRAGNITLLLMKGKEEDSYIKAKDNYEKMQQMIASGARFTFHDDRSSRILPAGVRPVPDKRNIDIPPENSQRELPEPKRKGRVPKRPAKVFHMPDDVETGFTRASTLAGDKPQKKKAAAPKKAATPKKRPRTPTPEPVDVPSVEDVVLSTSEQNDLEHHYQNIGATSPQFIRFPRNDAFPRLQLIERPTKNVKHGSLTQRMVKALRKMHEAGPDCDHRFKEILAREPPSSDESSQTVRSDSNKKPRRNPKPLKTPSKNTARRTTTKATANPAGGEVVSLLSPDREPKQKNDPFAFIDDDFGDSGSDFELMDASLLFSSGSKPKGPKPNRPIIEDSDE